MNQMKFLFAGVLSLFLTVQSGLSLAYQFPANDGGKLDENAQLLQRMSKSVAKISQQSEKALVYISLYKMTRTGGSGAYPGHPGYVDPFEYFFGPDYRRQNPPPQGGRRGNSPQERRESGVGSGFIVDLERGYIMTNNHVVQDADEIQLKLSNGETHQGTVVGRDKNTDVAIVQVKDKNFGRTGLAALQLGNSDDVGKGDFVVALGAPFGLESSISFGVVSAISRGNLDITELGNFIQTDAAINPGNSGGPLLNMAGQVVGVNTAIFSKSGAYNGIGFAIPANLARKIGEQIINTGKVVRGFIGVNLQQVDDELEKALNLPKDTGGALIREVTEGGPAERAGMKPGDVVTAINGRSMHSPSDLSNSVGLTAPGTTLDFTIYREGKRKNINVKVDLRPEENTIASKSRGAPSDDKDSPGDSSAFGLTVAPMNNGLRDKFKFTSKSGLVVTDVNQGSEADRVGLQPGDVIVEVNGQKIKDANQFKSLSRQAGQRLLIRVERKGSFTFVSLRKS